MIQTLNLGTSPNSGNGDKLRIAASKINDNFAFLNNRESGWEELEDTLHTVGSPQLVTAGVTTLLTNNGGIRINDQLPTGVTQLFDIPTTKLTPIDEGDFYVVDLMFKVKNSVLSGHFDVWVDIGGIGERFRQTIICPKSAGTETSVNVNFNHFTSGQFAFNGGEVKIKAEVGDLQIYDKQFRICRVHQTNY